MSPDKDKLYWDMRQEDTEFLQRRHWQEYHRLAGTLASLRRREQQQLSREAERQVADLLISMGYLAHLTTNNCPFDLWVMDDRRRAARVEVKISKFAPCSDPRKGGRFQANIHHDQADLVVFIARNGRDWYYVIPMANIAPRHNIAIWSPCPGEYTGQWQHYLNAWHYLDQIVANSQPRAWQLSMVM